MTSKLRQRATSILALLAIVVLLVIIVVVWVQVGNGAFSPKQDYNVTVTVSEEAAPRLTEGAVWRHNQSEKACVSGYLLRWPSVTLPDLGEQGRGRPLQNLEDDDIERTHLDDLGHSSQTELVRPFKVSPQSLRNADDQATTNETDDAPSHHHFRHKAAEIWDAHPEYEIDAFGTKLHLLLTYNSNFVSTDLYITHYFDNYTERFKHDPKTTGCFYSGVVKDDKNSSVAVSLCNGMTGYIHTSSGNYYIEPAEKFDTNSTSSLLHRIRKVHDENGYEGNSESSQCETQDKVIFDDDFEDDTTVDRVRRQIMKREILRFDDIDSMETPGNYTYRAEYRRSSREIVWSPEYSSSARRADNREYFIEVLIVADKRMMEYHRTKDNLIHYILTLMAHVALLFKDATVGNPVSLALTKISILNDKVFSSESSWEMLKKFCEWQNENNHGVQHDTAILLTREMICKNSTVDDCNTLGVAEVGSMCQNSSCAVVRDKGLSTSFTIAHEIGHLLSMQHDDHNKCLKYSEYGKAKNIMSKVLMNDTKPWQWSACSRHFLTEFLNSPKAHCLLDRPEKHYMPDKFSNVLPGEFFEADRQCELEFGIGSRMCTFTVKDMPKCASLWCTIGRAESGGCRTQHMPWADGTSCGFNRWCHHGRCIALDRESLAPIDGAWGAWQPWGECSRTCGGGIRISNRSCDSPPPSNGGSYCIGGGVRYESCNSNDCDPDTVDFRAIQCSAFNGNSFEHKNLTNVKWVPKYDDLPDSVNMCSLICQVEGARNIHSTLREKVVDGTKCSFNSFDICVDGRCTAGGCDNRIDSKLMLDDCGVCNGDNSTCIEINGTYNLRSAYGYHKVVRIPKGSSNIHIQQYGYMKNKHDDNYLVLVDGLTGNFILNGNFVITTSSVEIIYGGLTIMYSGSAKTTEEIRTPKNIKLRRDLVLQVLTVGEILPPNITYHYTIDKSNAPKYGWHLVNRKWSECNSICSGTRYMLPTCMDLATNTIVHDSKCPEWTMHSRTLKQECNTHCQLVWNISSTGPCLAHCGTGVRNLYYKCMQVDSNIQHLEVINSHVGYGGYGVQVDENHCAHLQKPPLYEPCEGSCDSTSWQYSEWSQCTKTCGTGRQIRTAKCVDDKNEVLDDSHCESTRKFVEQFCNTERCPVWSYGDWSSCSVTCGKGIRTQPYYCTINGQVTTPSSCNLRELQILKEECELEPCELNVRWFSGNWSDCSATCGNGFQKRDVSCRTYDHANVPDSHCREYLKPLSRKPCVLEQCEVLGKYRWGDKWPSKIENEITDNSIFPYDNFKWITGAWTQCSKTCNTGVKSRMVICRNGSGKENPDMCELKSRPIEHVTCNVEPCPKWTFGDWGECNLLCERRRQVICQNSTGSIVPDEQCDHSDRPNNSSFCSSEQCSRKPPSIHQHYPRKKPHVWETRKNLRYKWKTGAWGTCSKSCGRSVKTRTVTCRDTANDLVVDDGHCRSLIRPKVARYCKQINRAHCSFVWVEGRWSQCSRTCGEGTRLRNVTCHRVTPSGVDPSPVIHHNKCDLASKPPVRERCAQRECNTHFQWRSTPWSQCSENCGRRGLQKRRVYCVNARDQRVKRRLCPRQTRPAKKKKCNRYPCRDGSCKDIKNRLKISANHDYNLLINGKVTRVYCYKMDTREPEEFISLSPGKENHAQFFNKRLHNTQSCPQHKNPDDCDCTVIRDGRAGFTNFWKVRLNITSLQIIPHDFTFSTTNGTKQQYGTAGDCYSEREGCVQGRFSIDLTGTAFRLSDSVRWLSHGRKATVKMDNFHSRQVKKGTCGGNCGNCMPDPNFGLMVEIT